MNTTEIEQLSQDVAVALGSPWKFKANDEPYPTQHIDGANEAQLFLNLGTYGADKGRVTISGSLHIGKNGQYQTVYQGCNRVSVPSISVNVARGAAAIAKEIQRRLLPEYLRILALAVAQRDAQIEHENATRNNLVALAKIVNANVRDGDSVNSASFYRNDGAYGTIQAFKESASLELRSLTIAQATQILQLIRK